MSSNQNGGVAPGRTGVGTWSGGRFMNFGEKVDEDRLAAVLRPGDGIDTAITADTYGQGDADRLLGRAIAGVDRGSYSLVGAVGHDFYEGERVGPKGFPRFTDPRLRGPGEYAGYLRMAAEASLERLGQDRFDLLLLHNPDHTGYTSEVVWDGMAALKEDGTASAIGVAPGPANGFTLDMLDCFDRFGDRIDWAMIILNPLEPWPGEMVLAAAEAAEIGVITRVVDHGGLFWGDVTDIETFPPHDHRRFRPAGWIEAGNAKIADMVPLAERRGLTPLQLACQWNLAHPAVRCVVPTIVQEAGPGARPVEDKRAELAALPEQALTEADVETIRGIGDNHGCMALKGATPAHEGEPVADSWPLNPELVAAGERWGVNPDRDLVMTAA
ncbi:MAG: aldo/keto reductase [Solirubrobacterales bacterium]|nr:aldo/keto reductase [Solirubrobacterales bacterium]